ncbi:hypothetical protein [Microbacterium sp. UBA837]|nr:hypothetical protein [Microbacterium sp. UBA837]
MRRRIEDIVAEQADPPDLPYECAYCEKRHKYRVVAANCCDPISFELGYD